MQQRKIIFVKEMEKNGTTCRHSWDKQAEIEKGEIEREGPWNMGSKDTTMFLSLTRQGKERKRKDREGDRERKREGER